jgi:hypothetical protein
MEVGRGRRLEANLDSQIVLRRASELSQRLQ